VSGLRAADLGAVQRPGSERRHLLGACAGRVDSAAAGTVVPNRDPFAIETNRQS